MNYEVIYFESVNEAPWTAAKHVEKEGDTAILFFHAISYKSNQSKVKSLMIFSVLERPHHQKGWSYQDHMVLPKDPLQNPL